MPGAKRWRLLIFILAYDLLYFNYCNLLGMNSLFLVHFILISLGLSIVPKSSKMIDSSSQEPWLVLYVKRHTEKKVASRLATAGVTSYLPTITVMRQWSDRKKKLQIPAVSGVLFVQCAEAQKNAVFDVPGTLRYLHIDGGLAKVPHKELEAMDNYLDGKGLIDQTQYQKGQEIYLDAFKASGVISKIGAHHFWVTLPDSGFTVRLRAA